MKTDDLVSLLATDLRPVAANASLHRFSAAMAVGGLVAALAMATGFGVRADLAVLALTPMFWVKLAFPGVLAAAALVIAMRLSLPGRLLGGAWVGIAVPVLLVWAMGLAALLNAPAAEREGLLLGASWRSCSLSIAMVSSPVFIAVMWAMKDLAPTRLRLAGAAGGLLAGAVGAFVYAFHCPEMAAPFLGIWYALGMAIPALAGGLLGPRLLRW